MKKPDRQRLKKALSKSTSTPHDNNLQPSARKQNDANNSHLKKGANTSPPEVTKSTMLKSGVGIATTRAFGVPPLKLL